MVGAGWTTTTLRTCAPAVATISIFGQRVFLETNLCDYPRISRVLHAMSQPGGGGNWLTLFYANVFFACVSFSICVPTLYGYVSNCAPHTVPPNQTIFTSQEHMVQTIIYSIDIDSLVSKLILVPRLSIPPPRVKFLFSDLSGACAIFLARSLLASPGTYFR